MIKNKNLRTVVAFFNVLIHAFWGTFLTLSWCLGNGQALLSTLPPPPPPSSPPAPPTSPTVPAPPTPPPPPRGRLSPYLTPGPPASCPPRSNAPTCSCRWDKNFSFCFFCYIEFSTLRIVPVCQRNRQLDFISCNKRTFIVSLRQIILNKEVPIWGGYPSWNSLAG